MMTANVKHPILRLEVLGADGTRTMDHIVFCRKQRQSVNVEECCGCVHCEAITEGPMASVDCSIELGPHGRAVDPDGESTDVGTLLCRGTVVVAESASLGCALAVLREGDRRSVAVVDERHVMIGLVHETTTMFGRSRVGDDRVGAAMTSAIAVDERTPVRVALRLLAANHLREATVVSKRGVPIGVFRDVDGLRWIGGR